MSLPTREDLAMLEQRATEAEALRDYYDKEIRRLYHGLYGHEECHTDLTKTAVDGALAIHHAWHEQRPKELEALRTKLAEVEAARDAALTGRDEIATALSRIQDAENRIREHARRNCPYWQRAGIDYCTHCGGHEHLCFETGDKERADMLTLHVETLREALRELNEALVEQTCHGDYDGPCFCETNIGKRVRRTEHEPYCLRAKAAIDAAETALATIPTSRLSTALELVRDRAECAMGSEHEETRQLAYFTMRDVEEALAGRPAAGLMGKIRALCEAVAERGVGASKEDHAVEEALAALYAEAPSLRKE